MAYLDIEERMAISERRVCLVSLKKFLTDNPFPNEWDVDGIVFLNKSESIIGSELMDNLYIEYVIGGKA